MLYGSFSDDEDLERDFETVSPVPTVKVDDTAQKFLIAGHECFSFSSVYTFSSENNVFGKLDDPDTTTNISTETSFDYVYGGTIIAAYRQIPKLAGAGTTAPYPERISDSIYDTWTDVGHGIGNVYRMLEPPKQIGDLCDAIGGSAKFKLRLYMMGVYDYEPGKLFLSMDGFATAAITASSFITADTASGLTWLHLTTSKFGIFDNGAIAMTASARHLVVEYYVKAYNLTRSQLPRQSSGATTSPSRGTRSGRRG